MNDETTPISESRSSIEISTTAAGKALVKVKVYAEGTDIDDADAAAQKAIRLYLDTTATLP